MIPGAHPLEGRLRSYPWGGDTFLRDLTGGGGDGPVAEWWLGGHPDAPSIVRLQDGDAPLDAVVAASPVAVLGPAVAARFGRLPFLLKVLDVRGMLSLQVHPDRARARRRFVEEAGLPSERRHYRDDNHKPEMMVALDRFHLLHGFRPVDGIVAALSRHAGTRDLAADVTRRGLSAAYAALFAMPADEIESRLAAVVAAGRDADDTVPEHWLARAADTFGRHDPGLFAFFFLDLLILAPGEAIHQPAGLPHGYLHGRCIELMANSDNVIRAGLTTKSVDIAELLEVIDTAPTPPHRMPATAPAPRITRWETPCDDFALDLVRPVPDEPTILVAEGPEILLAMAGTALVEAANGRFDLPRGRALFLTSGARATLTGSPGTEVFRARVGLEAAHGGT